MNALSEKIITSSTYGTTTPIDPPYIVACLMMRNETTILPRWVNAVAPHIDAIMCLDTGSDDGSQNMLRRLVHEIRPDVQVVIEQSDWANFGWGRNQLLDAARGYYGDGTNTWFLNLDADHVPLFTPGWLSWLTTRTNPYLSLRHGGTLQYWIPRLLRSNALNDNVRWRGATHEYLNLPTPPQHFTGIVINDHGDGSSHAIKLQRDQELLTRHLETHRRDARTHFYLAQTLRDIGGQPNYTRAAVHYLDCARYSTWDEERYYALYQSARCLTFTGNLDAVPERALMAHAMRPTRLEALVLAASVLVSLGQPIEDVQHLLAPYANTPIPNDNLFVEPDAWTHRDAILALKGEQL